jgi:hypothetical protein
MAENNVRNKYLITVEGIAPVIASFEVWAYSDEEAADIFLKQPHLVTPRDPPHVLKLSMLKPSKLTVKDLLTGLVKFVKNM